MQNIGGSLYVTFAKEDPESTTTSTGAGLGYVDVFSPGGRLLRRLEHGPWLNAPWGWPWRRATSGPSATTCWSASSAAARSPPTTWRAGTSSARCATPTDTVLAIDGLWALSFGNGATAGPLNTLFFTAGSRTKATASSGASRPWPPTSPSETDDRGSLVNGGTVAAVPPSVRNTPGPLRPSEPRFRPKGVAPPAPSAVRWTRGGRWTWTRFKSSDHGAPLRPGHSCLLGLCGIAAAGPDDKVPITTRSEEARQLYLKGRDLADTLRATDARKFYQEAVAKDPSFARAYLDLANTAGTAKEFFDGVKQAVALADKASEPERLMIMGLDAGTKGDVAGQKALYSKLVEGFPKDERALVLLGNFYFGQQDYPAAIAEYNKATAAAPSFSQPYNQLGYSYRFLGKYAEAEQAFKKYIELIPNDPNPYDSHAELLMKMGRFEDSIGSYEKALTFDRNFAASYVGIGNDHVFLGHGDAARASYGRLTSVARNNGERRLAIFWSALSHVHEGATAPALAEIDTMSALAKADGDLAALSGDANLAANILLEAGDADKAVTRFADGMASIDKADVPAAGEGGGAPHRPLRPRPRGACQGRPQGPRTPRPTSTGGRSPRPNRFPSRCARQHELAGRIVLVEKDYAAALARAGPGEPAGPPGPLPDRPGAPGEGRRAKAQRGLHARRGLQRAQPELRLRQGEGEGDAREAVGGMTS